MIDVSIARDGFDVAELIISALTAVGSLTAIALSVFLARTARGDAIAEGARADLADQRATAAILAAAAVQVNASERIARSAKESENEQRIYSRLLSSSPTPV